LENKKKSRPGGGEKLPSEIWQEDEKRGEGVGKAEEQNFIVKRRGNLGYSKKRGGEDDRRKE